MFGSAKRLGAALAVALAVGAGDARADDDARECAFMGDAAARLACFDTVFPRQATPRVPGGQTWFESAETSKLSGRPNVKVQAFSRERVTNPQGPREYLRLIVACEDGASSLQIDFAGNMMAAVATRPAAQAGRAVKVGFRIDNRPPGFLSFEESPDRATVGLWSKADVRRFVGLSRGAATLYVEAAQFGGQKIAGDFDVSGFEDALKPVAAACDW